MGCGSCHISDVPYYLTGQIFVARVCTILVLQRLWLRLEFGLNTILYADDLSIHLTSNYPLRTYRFLYKQQSIAFTSGSPLGFRICTSENHLLIFQQRRTHSNPFSFWPNNTIIPGSSLNQISRLKLKFIEASRKRTYSKC